MRARPRSARGFTLIELMMVVAIVGVLSTVAYPTMTKATLRSKASERSFMLRAIDTSITDVYRTKDRFPPDPAVSSITGDYNPTRPYSTGKRRFDPFMTNWAVLAPYMQIEGDLYYSYRFEGNEETSGAPPGAWIEASGDLDGDGDPSITLITYVRDHGAYVPNGDPQALEDWTRW